MPDKRFSTRFCVISIAIISLTIIGLILRVLMLNNLSFWIDELWHVDAATNIVRQGRAVASWGGVYKRALAFTYLIALSFRAFGINEFAARLPSVLFGTVTIPALYLIASRWLNQRVGLISATMLTFSPWAIEWSRRARMYSLFQLLFLVLVYLFLRGFEADVDEDKDLADESSPEQGRMLFFERARNYVSNQRLDIKYLLISLVLFAICYDNQPLTVMLIPVVFTYALFMLYRLRNKPLTEILVSKYLIVVTICIFSLFLFIFASGLPTIRELAFLSIKFRYWYIWALVKDYSLILSLIFGVFGCIALFKDSEHLDDQRIKSVKSLYLLIAVLVPLFLHVFLIQPIYEHLHNVYYLLPLILIVLSYGIFHVSEYLRNLLSKQWPSLSHQMPADVIVILLLVVYLPIGTAWNVHSKPQAMHPWLRPNVLNRGGVMSFIDQKIQYAERFDVHHPNWKKAVEYVRKNSLSKDIILSTDPLAAKYYLGRCDYLLRQGTYDLFEKSSPELKILKTPSALMDVVRKNRRGWVVVDVRFWFDSFVDPTVREFVEHRMVFHKAASDNTVWVYEWNEKTNQK